MSVRSLGFDSLIYNNIKNQKNGEHWPTACSLSSSDTSSSGKKVQRLAKIKHDHTFRLPVTRVDGH